MLICWLMILLTPQVNLKIHILRAIALACMSTCLFACSLARSLKVQVHTRKINSLVLLLLLRCHCFNPATHKHRIIMFKIALILLNHIIYIHRLFTHARHFKIHQVWQKYRIHLTMNIKKSDYAILLLCVLHTYKPFIAFCFVSSMKNNLLWSGKSSIVTSI